MASSVPVTSAPAGKLPSQAAPNMTRLSPSVSLYRPASDLAPVDPTAPRLILLATWMDARDVHIAKYVVRYQTLYPTACILLVKSFFWYFFSPSSARRELMPAVSVIRDLIDHPSSSSQTADDTEPHMLIHIFSNGGSYMLCQMYDLYAETKAATASQGAITDKNRSNPDLLLPPHVNIFDSVPGRWSYSASTRAVLLALPAGWARTMALPLVRLLGMWWFIKYRLFRVPDEMYEWGLSHNDPVRARETCRAYIYSEADEFVDYRAVEEHINHAETNGYVIVRRDKFPNSPHVSHARSDPERYWSIVRETWEVGRSEGARSQKV